MGHLLITLLFSWAYAGEGIFKTCPDVPRDPYSDDSHCYMHNTAGRGTKLLSDKLKAEEMAAALKPRVSENINLSISARTFLLDCLNQPQRTADCQQRIEAMQRSLDAHVHLIRMTAALSNRTGQLGDTTIPRQLHLPAYIGSRRLPPLTKDEMTVAQRLQNRFLNAIKSNEDARNAAEDSLCQGQEDCQERDARRIDKLNHMHQIAGGIEEQLIAEMPMAARFDTTPITEDRLKQELQSTQKALVAWRDQINKTEDVGELLIDYPDVSASFLAANPQYCRIARNRFQVVENKEMLTHAAEVAGHVALATGTCLVTTGMGCAAIGATIASVPLLGSSGKMREMQDRYTALDAGGKVEDLKNAHRDVLVDAAFAVVGSIPLGMVVFSEVEEEGANSMARAFLHEARNSSRDEAVQVFGKGTTRAFVGAAANEADSYGKVLFEILKNER